MTDEAPPDPRPVEEPHPEPAAGRAVPRVVVPRWIQLVLLPLAVLAAYVLVKAAGPVVLVFLVAGVIALVLNPLVRLLERTRLPHGVCVLAVYLGFFAAGTGIVLVLITPVSDQAQAFQRDVPGLVDQANARLADLQDYFDRNGVRVRIKEQGQTALDTIQRRLLAGTGDVVTATRDVLQRGIEGAVALLLVLVVSVYMLLYAGGIGRLVRRLMPPGDGTPEDDFPLRAQKAVFSYVRGQLLFSLIMGATAGVALWLFGVLGIFPDGQRYALVFGAIFGVMELVPYVGPVLGAIPPILVALFQDPLTAVWVGLLFLALQQLEGHVVAPQLFGHSLRLNPLIIIFALLLGAQLYGIIGAFIALPLAAVGRETVVYLQRHLVLEPWGALSPIAPAAGPCPACGAPATPGDDYCRRCGADLTDTGSLARREA